MDLDSAIKNRRSIRRYNDKDITISDIYKIIEAATWAPTACDSQDFLFIILDRSKIDIILSRGGASFLKKVNKAVLVLYSNRTENLEYMDYVQSGAAAIQNLLLKAYSIGLGACWICNLPPKKYLRKILNIPRFYDPIALISIGYYDKEPKKKAREKPLEDLISFNNFNFQVNKDKVFIKILFKRIIRKLYFQFSYIRFLNKFAKKYEKKFTD